MANHYVSLARGEEGMKASDFTTGTSSAATDLFEFLPEAMREIADLSHPI